jgi:hypothetical protein
VSRSTYHALASQGPVGSADAAFARATAPAPASRAGNGDSPSGNGDTPSGNSPSPAAAVLKSLTGSASGGLGPLLPAIMVLAAIGAGVLAIARHRKRRAGS